MSDPEPFLNDPLGHDPRPTVRLPRRGMPGMVIAFGAVTLALMLFFILNGRREQRLLGPKPVAESNGFAPPPPLSVPVVPEPVASIARTSVVTKLAPILPSVRNDRPILRSFSPPIITPVQEVPLPLSLVHDATNPREQKAKSSMVFDLGADPAIADPTLTGSLAANGAQTGGAAGASGSDDIVAQATSMRSRTDVVPIGTLVPIVLETPIDTAKPGLVRAIASRDTRGFDGRRILIPRGSRFIGEYQADVRSGQNRVLVTWTRLIRPDGVTIRLGSPAADELGGSGVPGKVNSFFFQRFTGAVLQSALTVGVNLASRPRSGSVVIGIPSGPISSIGQGLIPNDYRPKITVKQGEALNVFVARDLDFSGLSAGQR